MTRKVLCRALLRPKKCGSGMKLATFNLRSRYVTLVPRYVFTSSSEVRVVVLYAQVRLENGPFVALSTLFPDPRLAFTFIPDVSLPAAAPALPSPFQLLTEEHARLSSQASQLERETDGLKKLGADVSQLFNHHHALLQQAKAAHQVEAAMQQQSVSSQYYNQLNSIHVEVSAKLKALGQLRAHLQGLETQMRQLMPPSGSSLASPATSSAAAVKAEQVAKAAAAEQQRAAVLAEQQRAAAAAEQQRVAAAAAEQRAVAEQQRAAAEQQRVAAEQQRVAAAAEQQRAAAALVEQQRAEQARRSAKEAAERDSQAVAEKPRTAAVAWSAIAAKGSASVTVPVQTVIVDEAPVEPSVVAPSPVVEMANPSRPSLLEQQTVEAARKLGILPRAAQPEDSSASVDAAASGVWVASATPKSAAPSKSLSQIQVSPLPRACEAFTCRHACVECAEGRGSTSVRCCSC